jgi:GR25 family glycosyltransferase involved in LPS biosynthesis
MVSTMIDCLYYINLDSRTDRREHIEKNVIPIFEKHVKNIKRFPAFDHTNYETVTQRAAGCAFSHLQVWRESIFEKFDKVLILEDDFEFIVDSKTVDEVLELLNKIDFELCNLAYVTTSPVYKTNLKYIYKCNAIQTASCYIANSNFLEKMIPSIKEAADNLMTNQNHHGNAIDIAWQKFQNNSKWYLTKRLGKQLVGHSNIQNYYVDYAYAELRDSL